MSTTLLANLPATKSGWRPALAAVALAATHLGLTFHYARNWDGDETRSPMMLAFLAVIAGLGLVLVAIGRTGGWSGGVIGVLGRAVAAVTGIAFSASIVGGLWVWREPLSEDADRLMDVAMWGLMGAMTLAVALACANARWRTSYRWAVAPLATLFPVALVSFVGNYENTWWTWQVMIAASIALAGFVLGRRA